MKKLLFLLSICGFILCLRPVNGQTPVYQNVVFVSSAPAGACTNGSPAQIVISTGVLYTCQAGTWGSVGGGGAAAPTVTISTSGPVTVPSTGSGYWFNNAGAAITFNLPTPASGDVGKQFCFQQYPNSGATNTGVITLKAPASVFIGALGSTASSGGSYVSSGTAADSACVMVVSTTLYAAYPGGGVWSNN